MDIHKIKCEDLKENELDNFCDLAVDNLLTEYEFTIGEET